MSDTSQATNQTVGDDHFDAARGMRVFVPGETPLGRWWTVERIRPHWSGNDQLLVVAFTTSDDGACHIELMLRFNEKVRVKR
jgi:hypothetical protein